MLSRIELLNLMVRRPWLTWSKFGLMLVLMAILGTLAWASPSAWVDWPCYVTLGYLWMSIVTFMHDATHDALLVRPWHNWAFGIASMLLLPVSFVAFREDHLRHHRFNRSTLDPDAFTMGHRRFADFLIFYLYLAVGGVLTTLQFALIFPFQHFGRRQWAIHLFEFSLKLAAYTALLSWAAGAGLVAQVLALWLWPLLFFSAFNSLRFIAEHYETPWNQGNLAGTRTVTSNRLHSFFWNNINWHIGHHVYPKVPWHNLVRLHERLATQIEAQGGVVDAGYASVCWRSLWRGPESEPRLQRFLAARRQTTTRTLRFADNAQA
ncbi:MAG: fatty acid desaturase [Sinobacteraceae bacterium]|nr:fatty acid desaturase [Nevskiaceae bacterium]